MGRANPVTLAVICALLAALPAISAEPERKVPHAAAKKAFVRPNPVSLTQPPPNGNLKERAAWAGNEASRLRAVLATSPRDTRTRMLMAALAVVVATDLERSLAVADIATATTLRGTIERSLPDTQWSLDLIARHGAGGGDFALAVMALHGILGQRDIDKACSLLSSAWGKGFGESAYRLSGCVAGRDPTREALLLRVAADAGNAAAGEMLGRRCLESTPQDARCASARVSAAAASGRPSAKSLLGWMHAQGVGVAADPLRAQALYLDAAGAGDLSAKNNLGELYETGRGVAIDRARAAAYYREAAEAGFAAAQFNLGRLYAAGAGVPKDTDQARTWLRAALNGGVRPAQEILDWLDTQTAPKR